LSPFEQKEINWWPDPQIIYINSALVLHKNIKALYLLLLEQLVSKIILKPIQTNEYTNEGFQYTFIILTIVQTIMAKIIDLAAFYEDLLIKACTKRRKIREEHFIISLDKLHKFLGEKITTEVVDHVLNNERTTAHAILVSNSEKNKKRKFFLVEKTNQFEEVILPRIKKLSYSFTWKNGSPKDQDGEGVFIKYQILENH
jgi:hypothetical protein